jgi:hypothetical protein
VKAFVLCSLIASTGVGYVNQKNRIHLLSDQMRKLEIQRDRQRVHQQILLRKLTALNSPNELESSGTEDESRSRTYAGGSHCPLIHRAIGCRQEKRSCS